MCQTAPARHVRRDEAPPGCVQHGAEALAGSLVPARLGETGQQQVQFKDPLHFQHREGMRRGGMIRGDNQLGLGPFEVSALVRHDPV